MKRDLLTLADVTPEELEQLLTLAIDLKQRHKHGEPMPLWLASLWCCCSVNLPCARGVSFELGMVQLGGHQ